jgi:4-amino-4-deoxy-L-arabinose transferase-like glycosyltransferase
MYGSEGRVRQAPIGAPAAVGTGRSLPLPTGAAEGRLGWWWLGLLALAALALQLAALTRLEGYQLADSVEYLDRAHAFVRGERLDPGTVRSFAFSALLAPLFALARALGLEDLRAAVAAARALQMLFALGSVCLLADLARRLFGPAAGVGAGLALALNPIVAQYAIEPLSGTAAAFFLVLGLRGLALGRGWMAGMRTGLACGAAILMAFQTIPVVAALLGGSFLFQRAPRWSTAGGWLLGLTPPLLGQCLLDLLVYGSFGSSLGAYFLENSGSILALQLRRLGFDEVAAQIYRKIYGAPGSEVVPQLRSLKPRDWYYRHFTAQCLSWSTLALIGLGLIAAWKRQRALLFVLVPTLVLNAIALSSKGEKSFRLWLPLLPLLALLAGAGLALLWAARPAGERIEPAQAPARPGAFRLLLRGLALALVLAGALFGWRTLQRTNLAKYGGYWQALELVRAQAPAGGERPRVGSVYHWAVQFRSGTELELAKLPAHIDQWKVLPEEQRAAVLAALPGYDWLIGHHQAFAQDARILEIVNREFEIERALWSIDTFEDLDPIYVLRARTGRPHARTFYELHEGLDPGPYQAGLQYPRSADFRRVHADGAVEQIVLLGYELDLSQAPQGLLWIDYHWFAGTPLLRDYIAIDRFADGRGGAFHNNHAPAHGALPTSRWPQGSIVRETHLVRVPQDPRGYGSAWCRGELIPTQLLLGLSEYGPSGELLGELRAYRPSARSPIPRPSPSSPLGGDGRRFSPEGLIQVGGFFLPTPLRARLADDGAKLPF